MRIEGVRAKIKLRVKMTNPKNIGGFSEIYPINKLGRTCWCKVRTYRILDFCSWDICITTSYDIYCIIPLLHKSTINLHIF